MNDFLHSVSPADPKDELGRFPVWDADALDEAVRGGRIQRDDIVLMAAFGAGLTWAGAVVRW